MAEKFSEVLVQSYTGCTRVQKSIAEWFCMREKLWPLVLAATRTLLSLQKDELWSSVALAEVVVFLPLGKRLFGFAAVEVGYW